MVQAVYRKPLNFLGKTSKPDSVFSISVCLTRIAEYSKI